MLLRALTACLAIICRGVAKEGELGWPWCPPIIIPEQPCVEVTAIVGVDSLFKENLCCPPYKILQMSSHIIICNESKFETATKKKFFKLRRINEFVLPVVRDSLCVRCFLNFYHSVN